MNRLTYFLKKTANKRKQKAIERQLIIDEGNFREQYLHEHPSNDRIKVCTYQSGFSRHYTRFYTSSNNADLNYELVESPADADAIVFINTIDNEVVTPGQRVIFFFHEPKSYAHLYQTRVDTKRILPGMLQVVGHLASPSNFISSDMDFEYLRSIPYVHFHHMATYPELLSLSRSPRTKEVCSVTSALNGIPGYQHRRDFFELLSRSNPAFDLFGRFSREAAELSAYRGVCPIKWETLSDYKYSLVIENSVEDYYVSEKIFDALLCGCMPIYHGSEKIFEILPDDWFYFLPTLDESELPALNRFLNSKKYLQILDNHEQIIEFIYDRYSFYSSLEKLIKHESLPITGQA